TEVPHLPAARLASLDLDPAEEQHVADCLRCRSERRLRLVETFTPDAVTGPPRVGPYEILGLLGAGGMGRVYEARRVGAAGEVPRVAIKVVTLLAGPARERFAREVRVQQRIDHPHVLPVLEVVYLAALPALVLPLVEGPTLKHL